MKRRLVHYHYADEIKVPKRLKRWTNGLCRIKKSVQSCFTSGTMGSAETNSFSGFSTLARCGRENCSPSDGTTGTRIIQIIYGSTRHSASPVWTIRNSAQRQLRILAVWSSSAPHAVESVVRRQPSGSLQVFIEAGHADSLRQLFETCAQAGRRGSWSRRHHAPDVAPVVLDDGVGFRGIT